MADQADRVHQFVARIQRFAGIIAGPTTGQERIYAFNELLDTVPTGSHAERLISTRLLAEALKRLSFSLGIVFDPPYNLTIEQIRQKFADLRRQRRTASASHVARFMQLLEERFRDPHLTQQTIAAALALSPSHLSRVINRETGHTFEWHLRRMRTARASHLLSSTDLSVKEIAFAAGFSTTSSLDHQFKAVFGATPSEFRHRMKRRHT